MADARAGDQLQEALALFKAREFEQVVDLLRPLAADGTDAETAALLGLAFFQVGRYNDATESLRAALKQDDRAEWRELLSIAETNAVAQVQEFVPPEQYYDRKVLLRSAGAASLPEPLPPRPRGLRTRLRIAFGNVFGEGVGRGFNGLILGWGQVAGWKGRIWTNWYRRPYFFSLITLGYMRERLNRDNLRSPYPKGTLVGFQQPGGSPPPGASHYRTADGTWNNFANPKEGAAGTRFPRNGAILPESANTLLEPNPRLISLELLTRGEEMKKVPFLNLLAACWIQFENHDWISHGEPLSQELHEIPLPEDDPARARYRQEAMFLAKTQPDPTAEANGDLTFINEVTHWWDGSQIYGSDEETLRRLRSGEQGKLRLNEDKTLPLGANGVEETGFVRNWWVGLSMLHALFANEHNAICDRLRRAYPGWKDEQLFQTARLINAAVMAKIHTVEWTAAILPHRVVDSALNSNWFGLLTNVFRRGTGRHTLADINVRNPELGGVVGNPIDKHGQPYGLTEEFVEVYRLHSLLPERLRLKSLTPNGDEEDLPFVAARQAGSPKVTARFSLGDLFHSFGTQHPGQLVLNNFPRFMQELSIPGNPLFDMGAADILRARERGVPRYNEFRRQLGLNPIGSIDDLTCNEKHREKLRAVYGEDVESIDLMVGTLAEKYRPTGFGFGETMFQIFILNATRRLQADRFYTDDYRADVYTPEGLAWVDAATLKSILLRHFPELRTTGLAHVNNAFEPWDTDLPLTKERHPLRAWSKEIKGDRWLAKR